MVEVVNPFCFEPLRRRQLLYAYPYTYTRHGDPEYVYEYGYGGFACEFRIEQRITKARKYESTKPIVNP